MNANDPHKDDEELQLTKAIAAARVLFNQRLGEYPPADQISAKITKNDSPHSDVVEERP